MLQNGTTTYFHQDHLSTRVLTNVNGTVVGELGHYPFGEKWYETGTTTKQKFTTYELDSETGNDYTTGRMYASALGRFLSPDVAPASLADPQSWNRYSYVENDPVNNTDPSGWCTWSWSLDMDNSAGFESGAGDFCEGGGGGGDSGGDWVYVGPSLDDSWWFNADNPGVSLRQMLAMREANLNSLGTTNGGADGGCAFGDCFGMEGARAEAAYVAMVAIAFDPPAKYTVNLKVLNDCLSKMGIKTTINSLTPSTPGGYGSASGVGEDRISGGGKIVPITVTNDAHTYDAAQIGAIVGSHFGYAFGFTDPSNPYTNYTNNNNSAYGTVDTQVWELGNSLSVIQSSKFIPVPTGDKEPGNVLTNCVKAGHGIQAK